MAITRSAHTRTLPHRLRQPLADATYNTDNTDNTTNTPKIDNTDNAPRTHHPIVIPKRRQFSLSFRAVP